eukprot:3139041-Alexandrium_andersonii.AAC.1
MTGTRDETQDTRDAMHVMPSEGLVADPADAREQSAWREGGGPADPALPHLWAQCLERLPANDERA